MGCVTAKYPRAPAGAQEIFEPPVANLIPKIASIEVDVGAA